MRALELRRKRQLAKAGEVKAPVSPKSNLESSRKLEALSTQAGSQNREPKENQTQNGEELPSHADRAKIDKDTSTKVTVPSGPDSEIAQAPADQRDTDTGHDDFFPIDSSLHSKDVEEISSTAGSDSATSEATLPSVKAAAIDNGPPPVLPPVPSQNRVGVDASSASPEQASEESRVLADDTEETVVTAVLVSPSLTAAPQVIADGNLSSQVTPKLGGSMDEKASPTQKPPPANVNELKLNTSNALYCPNPKTIQESLQVHEKAPLNTDASDTSDDESLYEELQSATVQEAKPVMVARSPISAIFNKGSPDRLRQHNGSVSSLKCKIDDTSNITPENLQDKFGRSLSSPLPQWPSTGEPVKSLLIKKTNVSSGISKRIRALEMFTGRSEAGSSPPNPNAPPSPPPTSGLVTERASAHSPKEKKGRNMSINTPPTKQFHYPSPEPTPTPPPTSLEKQSSWPQRLDSKGAVFPPRKKGEAISVTARIIRDSSEIQTDQQNYASKPAPSSLHRSPLVVEHEKADPIFQPEVIKPSKTFPSPSKEADTAPVDIPKSGRRRFSVSSRNSNADKPPQSESFTKRLSMTIRHGRTESSNLPRSGSDASSVGDEKVPKESRRTRLIKRMSVIKAKAGTRRTLASAFGSNASRHGESPAMVSQPPDSIVEQSGEVTPEDSSTGRSYAHVVDIGDVNVQFPDTLLWKRRFMRIDDQGYLILTPPTMEVNKRGISRRFHLSDFKPPALPSVEREELPFSIVLDFEDGSCLQCACESKYAQGQVMRCKLFAQDFQRLE